MVICTTGEQFQIWKSSLDLTLPPSMVFIMDRELEQELATIILLLFIVVGRARLMVVNVVEGGGEQSWGKD